MKGLSKGRYDETFAGEDDIGINDGIKLLARLCIKYVQLLQRHLHVSTDKHQIL